MGERALDGVGMSAALALAAVTTRDPEGTTNVGAESLARALLEANTHYAALAARLAAVETERKEASEALERCAEERHTYATEAAAVRAERDEARQALREILRHTGANEYGDCQARRDGEPHSNCRSVIFADARAALSPVAARPETDGG